MDSHYNDVKTKSTIYVMFYPNNSVNVDVNVDVYSLISRASSADFTIYSPGMILELSLERSHLLWGEFSAFSAADTIHNFPIFIPPGTQSHGLERTL